MGREEWQKYWSSQSDPRHAGSNREFFSKLAKESLFHTGPLEGKSILELGCGNGALFEHMAIDPKGYTGVDFSSSLLEQFRAERPGMELIHSDASTFLAETKNAYDVVFSFGVLQYLNRDELRQMFELQAKCVKPGGIAVHLGIPVKELGSVFFQGKGSSELISSGVHRGILKTIVSKFTNKIGNWHDIEILNLLSSSYAKEATIVGNISYLYRVNIVQKF